MFEHHSEPLLPRALFILRVCRSLLLAAVFTLASLALGVCGYHYLAGLGWVDSLLNASMILGGMGPVDTLPTDSAKIFASFYALYSGLFVIGVMGIVLASFIHRILHSFHHKKSEGI